MTKLRTGPAAMPLTELRTRLFRVAEALLSGEMDPIALSLKGHDEELVLMRATTLASLEREVETLRRRAGPDPRPLRGLGRLNGSAEDVIAGVRRRAAAGAEVKYADILADRYAAVDAPVRAVAESRPAVRRSSRRRG